MTEGNQPYPMTDAETELLPAATLGGRPAYDDGGDQSTTEVAKEQAAGVAQTGVQAGQHVASVAKDQAAQVTAEAGRQAKDLLDQARSELSQQATSQQQRLADGLKSLSQQLHSMARNTDQPGMAADLARQGGEVTEQVASWFDGREPAAVLRDVRSFARRRPGTFLLMAAGAGLLAGRLTRGLKDEAGDDSRQQPAGSQHELTSGSAGAAPLGYPETGGLTTGVPGSVGGYAGGYPATGGYGNAVPGGAVPGGVVPGGVVPGGAVPGGVVPGGAVPGGAIPGGVVPGGPIGEEPIPYAGQHGEFDYPAPGEPR